MSVQSEIDRIEAARDDIAEAIREQDVTVPAGTKLAALADLVRQIVGKVRTVCGKGPDDNGNIALSASDVGAAASSHTHSASDITSGALPVSRGGTGATTASGARTALGAAASSHTHAAATTVSDGFLSAKDKARLDAARVWTITVPTGWQAAGDGYRCTIPVAGVSADTQIVAVALAPDYVGNAAAEQAAAAWTYLETDSAYIRLYAPSPPDAAFGLIVAALPT